MAREFFMTVIPEKRSGPATSVAGP